MIVKPSIRRDLQRFPDFLGIGAQKAGTTWLHHNLRSHPDIWLPPVKELHYFNELYIPNNREWTAEQRRIKAIGAFTYHIRSTPEDKWNYRFLSAVASIIDADVSDAWYGEIFAAAGHRQICGEITPDYYALPRAGLSHVMRLNPNARIILILRDPIERSWSRIRMLTDQRPGLTVEQAWALDEVRDYSDYASILSKWRAYCRSDRLWIGFTDDISASPLDFLKNICEFLGVGFSSTYFREAAEPVFVGVERTIPGYLYNEMRTFFEPAYRQMAVEFPHPCSVWLGKHFP